eukprot:TRINITY_DN10175_c0_g1_i2.p1 TRINITY_DN10175_c0_g1~~TRINITY_DN10175_c0_g1_i2.p1  ORF type:complete len:293 (-),score=64.24 TRINITY_DN10175_c0_g1_i2:191-1069(-)
MLTPAILNSNEITATPLQIALLNNMLPKGLRFEVAGSFNHKKRPKHHLTQTKEPLNCTDGYSLRRAGKNKSLSKCRDILLKLKEHSGARFFLFASEGTLSAVEKKLKEGKYALASEFAEEVRKVWSNSWENSIPGSEAYIATTNLAWLFENLIRDLDITEKSSEVIQELQREVKKANGALRKFTDSTQVTCPAQETIKQSLKKMSEREKGALAQNIKKLEPSQLLGMLQIIKDEVDLTHATNGIELDLRILSSKVCRELDRYVKKALKYKKVESGMKSLGSLMQTHAEEQQV